jgi:hypothetical protein
MNKKKMSEAPDETVPKPPITPPVLKPQEKSLSAPITEVHERLPQMFEEWIFD